ncbi:LAME_0E09516g1_1 [Lachancea meyersii CBS 8951]|uniref:LAME_0E09516g1_1 n=1 Tax=Lachancea meyersii CBS 8951 TaxID=1266667 RepID=A0A1G4JJG5_9SACH|nr:LAME_0E09516g1_1 [Lachancea meyersii CBS 8951]
MYLDYSSRDEFADINSSFAEKYIEILYIERLDEPQFRLDYIKSRAKHLPAIQDLELKDLQGNYGWLTYIHGIILSREQIVDRMSLLLKCSTLYMVEFSLDGCSPEEAFYEKEENGIKEDRLKNAIKSAYLDFLQPCDKVIESLQSHFISSRPLEKFPFSQFDYLQKVLYQELYPKSSGSFKTHAGLLMMPIKFPASFKEVIGDNGRPKSAIKLRFHKWTGLKTGGSLFKLKREEVRPSLIENRIVSIWNTGKPEQMFEHYSQLLKMGKLSFTKQDGNETTIIMKEIEIRAEKRNDKVTRLGKVLSLDSSSASSYEREGVKAENSCVKDVDSVGEQGKNSLADEFSLPNTKERNSNCSRSLDPALDVVVGKSCADGFSEPDDDPSDRPQKLTNLPEATCPALSSPLDTVKILDVSSVSQVTTKTSSKTHSNSATERMPPSPDQDDEENEISALRYASINNHVADPAVNHAASRESQGSARNSSAISVERNNHNEGSLRSSLEHQQTMLIDGIELELNEIERDIMALLEKRRYEKEHADIVSPPAEVPADLRAEKARNFQKMRIELLEHEQDVLFSTNKVEPPNSRDGIIDRQLKLAAMQTPQANSKNSGAPRKMRPVKDIVATIERATMIVVANPERDEAIDSESVPRLMRRASSVTRLVLGIDANVMGNRSQSGTSNVSDVQVKDELCIAKSADLTSLDGIHAPGTRQRKTLDPEQHLKVEPNVINTVAIDQGCVNSSHQSKSSSLLQPPQETHRQNQRDEPSGSFEFDDFDKRSIVKVPIIPSPNLTKSPKRTKGRRSRANQAADAVGHCSERTAETQMEDSSHATSPEVAKKGARRRRPAEGQNMIDLARKHKKITRSEKLPSASSIAQTNTNLSIETAGRGLVLISSKQRKKHEEQTGESDSDSLPSRGNNEEFKEFFRRINYTPMYGRRPGASTASPSAAVAHKCHCSLKENCRNPFHDGPPQLLPRKGPTALQQYSPNASAFHYQQAGKRLMCQDLRDNNALHQAKFYHEANEGGEQLSGIFGRHEVQQYLNSANSGSTSVTQNDNTRLKSFKNTGKQDHYISGIYHHKMMTNQFSESESYDDDDDDEQSVIISSHLFPTGANCDVSPKSQELSKTRETRKKSGKHAPTEKSTSYSQESVFHSDALEMLNEGDEFCYDSRDAIKSCELSSLDQNLKNGNYYHDTDSGDNIRSHDLEDSASSWYSGASLWSPISSQIDAAVNTHLSKRANGLHDRQGVTRDLPLPPFVAANGVLVRPPSIRLDPHDPDYQHYTWVPSLDSRGEPDLVIKRPFREKSLRFTDKVKNLVSPLSGTTLALTRPKKPERRKPTYDEMYPALSKLKFRDFMRFKTQKLKEDLKYFSGVAKLCVIDFKERPLTAELELYEEELGF